MKPRRTFHSRHISKGCMNAFMYHGISLVCSVVPFSISIETETAERIPWRPYTSPSLPIGIRCTLISPLLLWTCVIVRQSWAEYVDDRLIAFSCTEVGWPTHLVTQIGKFLIKIINHPFGSCIHGSRVSTYFLVEIITPECRPPFANIFVCRCLLPISCTFVEGVYLLWLSQFRIFWAEIITKMHCMGCPIIEFATMLLHVYKVIIVFHDDSSVFHRHSRLQSIETTISLSNIRKSEVSSILIASYRFTFCVQPRIFCWFDSLWCDSWQRDAIARIRLNIVSLVPVLFVDSHLRFHHPGIYIVLTSECDSLLVTGNWCNRTPNRYIKHISNRIGNRFANKRFFHDEMVVFCHISACVVRYIERSVHKTNTDRPTCLFASC